MCIINYYHKLISLHIRYQTKHYTLTVYEQFNLPPPLSSVLIFVDVTILLRVPGDIDRVASLKVSIDNGDYANEFPTQDPSVCASLLKEWLRYAPFILILILFVLIHFILIYFILIPSREMYDPVIPNDVYQHCLDNCDKANYCSSIVTDLPDVNRLVLTYTIRFLQVYTTPHF